MLGRPTGFSEVSLRKMFVFLLRIGMLCLGFLKYYCEKCLLFFFLFLCIGMLCVGFSEVLLQKLFAFLFSFFMHWYALYKLF